MLALFKVMGNSATFVRHEKPEGPQSRRDQSRMPSTLTLKLPPSQRPPSRPKNLSISPVTFWQRRGDWPETVGSRWQSLNVHHRCRQSPGPFSIVLAQVMKHSKIVLDHSLCRELLNPFACLLGQRTHLGRVTQCPAKLSQHPMGIFGRKHEGVNTIKHDFRDATASEHTIGT